MISIVGSGPAAAAVEAALENVGAEFRSVSAEQLDQAEFAVVVGSAGESRFEVADERTRAEGVPWLAVELGGLGGRPVTDAGVAGLAPGESGGGVTYEALCARVEANAGPSTGEGGVEPREIPTRTERLAGAVAGHEVASHLDGEVVLGRVVTLPYTERALLPVPGERDRGLELTAGSRELEASLARAERGLDELVGLVTEVGEAESFPVPYYLAEVADTAGFSDATAPSKAAGVDPDWNRAFMKALGEGLERYCAGVYREQEFEHARQADLERALSPAAFVRGHEPETAIPWVEGLDLGTEEPVAVPAEFVHHPPPERRFGSAITTGLGLGNSTVEAVQSGLYEVIERDATMLAWYSSFEPMAVTVEAESVGTLESRASAEGLTATLCLVTMDIDVPVVAAAVHREHWPRFALGSAASLDVAEAAHSALSEALQNWMELRGMGPERAEEAAGAIGEYADLPDRVREFVDTDVSVDGADVTDTALSGEAELDAVLDRLERAGLSAYAVRTTTTDVEALGFEAVRVLVPGAQPLSFDEMRFGDRAESVPGELGFEPRPDRAHHPFP
jgi:ribosomal protein S12 methylthiotransferase accessory factor